MKMNNNLLNSLINYLVSIHAIKKAYITDSYSIWYVHENSLEIMLPDENLIDHPQSTDILNDAISKLSKSKGIDFDTFKRILLNSNYDLLEVRSSGDKISHGKIKLEEGINALSGLQGLIKDNANKKLKVKGKRKTIERYMNGINMLAPKAGSFIYSVEFELFDKQKENQDLNYNMDSGSSIGRYLNQSFAITLERISKNINNHENISPAKLLSLGVDVGFCDNFLNLFSSRSEKIEFNFNWSYKEDSENIPRSISFDKKAREKISKFKETLSNSKIRKFRDLPAYIEKYSWPIDEDKGKVHLRVIIDKRDYTCFIETDSELYETLKAEQAKKEILITSDLLFTSKRKTTVDVIKIYKIKLNSDLEIKINM